MRIERGPFCTAVLVSTMIQFALSAPAESAAPAMEIRSPAFKDGANIPRRHTCDGADVSPAIRWSGAPAGTRAFALIVDDPDAPAGTWVHWVVYDLPPETGELGEALAAVDTLPNGARQGINDFRKVGYGGPCPPPGPAHRYFFRLYALDKPTGLGPRATRQQVLNAIKGHVLAEATLMGRYQRK
ncbi:MAG TPA: YbhB/YbcL family Raf kinase inhibitor-like protein [candidate division Zixibacteria bacterium]|nr:YbhB/YbcL family Raf kinase inhibitor-like protein [candidate division Zixibacteria bacterium]